MFLMWFLDGLSPGLMLDHHIVLEHHIFPTFSHTYPKPYVTSLKSLDFRGLS